MTTKKMKKSSESSPSNPPPPTSFSSLPYDLALNILARISLIHRSTLSIVSKSFQSLLASRELYATRSLIGKTKDCLYVCLDLNMENHKLPRWFTLAPTPNQHKLIPIPLFNYDHPKYSTVVSIGSKIYIIGGYLKGRNSRSMVVLDCQSHQWSRLPKMRVPRQTPAAEVIDGKIYVIGGCDDEHDNIEDWGEVYDPKTQIWEPLSTTTLDNLVTQKSVVPGRLVMGGKVYDKDGLKLNLKKSICLVEIDKNVFCQIAIVFCSSLYWRDQKEDLAWSKVMGLEELPHNTSYFVLIANSCRGRRLTIWWKNSKIWCAEISFERRSFNELWGSVEWSKIVFDGGYDSDSDFFLESDFFLHSALVTH